MSFWCHFTNRNHTSIRTCCSPNFLMRQNRSLLMPNNLFSLCWQVPSFLLFLFPSKPFADQFPLTKRTPKLIFVVGFVTHYYHLFAQTGTIIRVVLCNVTMESRNTDSHNFADPVNVCFAMNNKERKNSTTSKINLILLDLLFRVLENDARGFIKHALISHGTEIFKMEGFLDQLLAFLTCLLVPFFIYNSMQLWLKLQI